MRLYQVAERGLPLRKKYKKKIICFFAYSYQQSSHPNTCISVNLVPVKPYIFQVYVPKKN